MEERINEKEFLKLAKQYKDLSPIKLIVDTHTHVGFTKHLKSKTDMTSAINKKDCDYNTLNVEGILKDMAQFSTYFNHKFKLCYEIFKTKIAPLKYTDLSDLFHQLDVNEFLDEHESIRVFNDSLFRIMRNRMWKMGGVQYVRVLMQKYGFTKEETVKVSKNKLIKLIRNCWLKNTANVHFLAREIIMVSCVMQDYRKTMNNEFFNNYSIWTMKNYGIKPLKQEMILWDY